MRQIQDEPELVLREVIYVVLHRVLGRCDPKCSVR